MRLQVLVDVQFDDPRLELDEGDVIDDIMELIEENIEDCPSTIQVADCDIPLYIQVKAIREADNYIDVN